MLTMQVICDWCFTPHDNRIRDGLRGREKTPRNAAMDYGWTYDSVHGKDMCRACVEKAGEKLSRPLVNALTRAARALP